MRIAHFLGLSLIDYPGRVAAVVWTAGCNLRCPFCYNPELVLPERVGRLALLDPQGVLGELGERAGFIEGLVVTGGEPTLQGELAGFLEGVKALGLKAKLDTNGTRPEVLESLIAAGLLDYVALDIKAPFARYHEFIGLPRGEAREVVGRVRRSLELLEKSGVEYELRTTLAPGLSPADIVEIRRRIPKGCRYVLQRFTVPRGKDLVGGVPRGRYLSGEEVEELARKLGCDFRV